MGVQSSNHRAAEVSCAIKFQKTDVVADGPGVILFVEHNLGDSNVSLVGVILVEVVVSNTDSEPAGALSITAVAGCDNHVLSYKRSSTHQRSTNTSTKKSNLVGELSSISLSSSNNPSTSSAQRGREGLLGELGGSPH